MSISQRGLTRLYVKAVSTELAVSHVDYFHPGGRGRAGGVLEHVQLHGSEGLGPISTALHSH